jgi:hypothetical protein
MPSVALGWVFHRERRSEQLGGISRLFATPLGFDPRAAKRPLESIAVDPRVGARYVTGNRRRL